jgi:endonuclease/exonuclease/phosphatase family metal-dependent hydrolase
MGRRLVSAEVGGWLVLGLHAESERQGSAERVRQLTRVAAALLEHPGPAVFGGDTNLRAEEEPEVDGLEGVTDAWAAAGAREADRATWRIGRRAARFDRVWCNPRATVVDLRCRHELAGLSDHLPVEVRLRAGGRDGS